ncbi:MAG: hypothetical protein ACPG5C_02215, partial [Alphaproteobacteria bacterium]
MITAVNAAEPASASVFAPAKLNLFLHVTGRIEQGPQAGLHSLESLFVFLSLGDRLRFSQAGEDALTMRPDLGVPRDRNLAWQALQAV